MKRQAVNPFLPSWEYIPDGGFRFGGVLVSNGDIGLPGHTDPRTASNFTGNTHGSILELNGRYYIFYHRQTDRSQYSRQACAEELVLEEDGRFRQSEMTSCGLNGGPLSGKGTYEARIACSLQKRRGNRFYHASVSCIRWSSASGRRGVTGRVHPINTSPALETGAVQDLNIFSSQAMNGGSVSPSGDLRKAVLS